MCDFDEGRRPIVPVTACDVAVTTSSRPPDDLLARALTISEALRCPFRERRKDALDLIREETGRPNLLVLTRAEIRLVTPAAVYWFHPNMARSRIEAALRGEPDRLAAYAGIGPGDRVLDATCGLGADATVLAHFVGNGGAVLALERSAVLAEIVKHGTQIYRHRTPAIVAAMRRLRVESGEAASRLADEHDKSWDLVYLDPMFDETLETSQGLELVRVLASHDPLPADAIDQARRVARRGVVMKDRTPGRRLMALGFGDLSDNGNVCYGRIEV